MHPTPAYGAQIVHVAVQAVDEQATAAMCRDIFGFKDLGTFSPKNLTTIWLYDGHTYLSAVKYLDDANSL